MAKLQRFDWGLWVDYSDNVDELAERLCKDNPVGWRIVEDDNKLIRQGGFAFYEVVYYSGDVESTDYQARVEALIAADTTGSIVSIHKVVNTRTIMRCKDYDLSKDVSVLFNSTFEG